jgi:hypothetical protein
VSKLEDKESSWKSCNLLLVAGPQLWPENSGSDNPSFPPPINSHRGSARKKRLYLIFHTSCPFFLLHTTYLLPGLIHSKCPPTRNRRMLYHLSFLLISSIDCYSSFQANQWLQFHCHQARWCPGMEHPNRTRYRIQFEQLNGIYSHSTSVDSLAPSSLASRTVASSSLP